MKTLKHNLFIALTCISTLSFAQKQTPPVVGTPKDFLLPTKNNLSLQNGMRATLVHYGAIPTVTVVLNIKTGNIH
jgi:hypothetical protein